MYNGLFLFLDTTESSSNAELLLKLVYREKFKENSYSFLKESINIKEASWLKDLKSIIDSTNWQRIQLLNDNETQVKSIAKYLIQQNSIITYKKFLKIWSKIDPSKATQFTEILKDNILKNGLTDVDNKFQLL